MKALSPRLCCRSSLNVVGCVTKKTCPQVKILTTLRRLRNFGCLTVDTKVLWPRPSKLRGMPKLMPFVVRSSSDSNTPGFRTHSMSRACPNLYTPAAASAAATATTTAATYCYCYCSDEDEDDCEHVRPKDLGPCHCCFQGFLGRLLNLAPG